MSTDALLDALRIRRTPFRYPAPAGVRTPRPTSEAHLPFASRYLPRSVILVPQLAVELEEGFRAFARQRAAVVAAPSSSIPRLVQKSAEHVQRFEAKRIADQSEGVVRSALEAVWEGVDTTVEGLETLLGFQDARGKRETGNTPEGRVPMDGTALYADVYHWAKFPQFNAGVPEVAATSGELKTPPATHTMWPKVVEDLQDNGGVCSLNDFTAAERRAVLKKAAVIAKYYERDVFYFCDGISFMVGINVTDHQSNTFDTLISDHHSLVRHHPNDPSLPVVVTSTYFAGMFDPYPIAHRLRASIVVPRDDPASADLKKAIGPKLAEAAGRTKARKAEEEKRNKEKEEQEKRGAGATAQGKKRCTLTYPDQDTITLHTLPFRPVPPHPNPYKTPPRSSKVSLPTLSPSSSVNSGYSDTPTASSFGLSSSPSTSISCIGSGQDRLSPPSSPPTSSASSAEEAAIQLASFVAQSATATVYRGVWGDKSVVVKKSRGGYEEMAWGELDTLRGPLRGAAGVVPLIQAFECEGAVFLVLEDGGEEVEEWEDLSIDSRRRLFLSLLRIHLDHHVAHGDLEPRNAVVASNGGAVRWIDWGLAETDHTCGGREQCGELRELWARFGLEGEEETMRRRAEEEGLRW